jgi:predicted heme/steroid binding protein
MGKSVMAAILVLSLAGVLGLAACGSGETETTEPTAQVTDAVTTIGTQTFALEELAQFDGKDGRPAYIAVDGVVYDVSDSQKWPSGAHTGCNLGAVAGQDLSDAIAQAPARMRSNLERMPVVGTLE